MQSNEIAPKPDLRPTAVKKIVAVLRSAAFSLSDEKLLQSQIETALAKSNIDFSREHHLDENDIPDFFFLGAEGGIVLEIKVKGSKRAIHDQCARYCLHEQVEELILATNVPLGFPPSIHGKPCYVVNLGLAWL